MTVARASEAVIGRIRPFILTVSFTVTSHACMIVATPHSCFGTVFASLYLQDWLTLLAVTLFFELIKEHDDAAHVIFVKLYQLFTSLLGVHVHLL